MHDAMTVDSKSVGDPARYRTLTDLEQRLEALPSAPEDDGQVALVVRKCEGGRREILDRIVVAPDSGIPGDAWKRRARPNGDMQIAVMQRDVAELIANGQPLTLFGDNLFLELDLSAGSLPPGSRVRVGGAILEVTPTAHNGCGKFRERFGDDALRFVSKGELRHRNLRGIYMRVLEAGEVGNGESVQVIFRAPAPFPAG
jgi:MOSC domain-containing protein YiiM